MTENALIVGEGSQVPAEWGEPGQVRAMAARLGHVLQNARDFTTDEMMLIGNYCLVSGLNPMRGEVYFYKNKGRICVVDGYKALVRWAERSAPYTSWDEDLPLADGELAHVRVYVMRTDQLAFFKAFVAAGIDPETATRRASKYGDGVVTKADTVTREGGPKDPPVGWTWRDVAKKRALKNALNQSHGAPSLKELADDSWRVNGVQTIEGDWSEIPGHVVEQGQAEAYAALAAQTRQATEAFQALTPEEQQAKAKGNNNLLHGDEGFEGFDTEPEQACAPEKCATCGMAADDPETGEFDSPPPGAENGPPEEPDTYAEIDAALLGRGREPAPYANKTIAQLTPEERADFAAKLAGPATVESKSVQRRKEIQAAAAEAPAQMPPNPIKARPAPKPQVQRPPAPAKAQPKPATKEEALERARQVLIGEALPTKELTEQVVKLAAEAPKAEAPAQVGSPAELFEAVKQATLHYHSIPHMLMALAKIHGVKAESWGQRNDYAWYTQARDELINYAHEQEKQAGVRK